MIYLRKERCFRILQILHYCDILFFSCSLYQDRFYSLYLFIICCNKLLFKTFLTVKLCNILERHVCNKLCGYFRVVLKSLSEFILCKRVAVVTLYYVISNQVCNLKHHLLSRIFFFYRFPSMSMLGSSGGDDSGALQKSLKVFGFQNLYDLEVLPTTID